MTAKKIDNILAEEEELIPSSGFLASVMERIEDEAAAPPPIPFPWKRAVPGMALAAGGFGWCVFEFVQMARSAAGQLTLTLPSMHGTATVDRPLQQACWVALALGVPLVSWLISKRMGGRAGLL